MKKVVATGKVAARGAGRDASEPTKNLVTRSVGATLILRENGVPPTDPEWDDCLKLLGRHDPDFSKVKVLVVTDGGAPTPLQRKRLAELVGDRPLRVAVVSESMGFRFVASAVALFLEIATFSKSEMSRAYDHLKMSGHERRQADRALAEMSAEIA